ncbi:MAG: phosphotransferase family protein [Bacteroidetes bacterium]|nr:MAG: phosphotransferase family protein [Bacteroidota bacterium]
MSTPWLDQTEKVRAGEELPLEALSHYLHARLGLEGEVEVEQFPKGHSNLTYLIRMDGRQMVLRRPPFGANIKSGHDMSREYRVLSGLISQYPKVPRPLLFCEDEAVIGAPFYIMERVEGVILRASMPKEMIPAPEVMAGIARGLISTFVELHAVDYQAAGLGELGRPQGYVERQINGWIGRYEKAKTDQIAEMEQVGKWLAAHLPPESGTALIHNDYKYDNVMLDAADWQQVVAILDWEMATLGDPLMDLGTSLGYWMDPEDPPQIRQLALSPTTLPGNPRRLEVAEQYARLSGRNIDHLVFYYAYGLYKIAVIVQQIYYRYKKGYTRDPRFAGLVHAVQGCALMAWQAIQKERIDRLF